MKLRQIAETLALTVKAGERGMDAEVTGGYAADLLSCAMAGARTGDVWLTLQGHLNVVAIASLADLTGIIVTENKPVSMDTIAKADEEGIPILSTPLPTFVLAGKLWELGVRG
jgi:predicted transcriptional regulator